MTTALLERRSFRMDELRVATRADGDLKMITGHAAVFNQDSEEIFGFVERIAPGAFATAIGRDDVRALWNHDANYVLGRNTAKTLRLSEDDVGLKIEIDPPDTQWARDLLVSIDRGDVTQMSFGFRTITDKWHTENSLTIRTLIEVELFDVSPVTFPAYPQTDVGLRSREAIAEEGRRRLAATGPEVRFLSDVPVAVAWLTNAIALHEGHMTGAVPVTDANQMLMMDQMKTALALLSSETGAEEGMRQARALHARASLAARPSPIALRRRALDLAERG